MKRFIKSINYKIITINNKYTKMKVRMTMNDIIKILFRDFSVEHTITSLAKALSLTRMGIWKSLKELEKNKLILLTTLGKGKTSIYKVKLNWENPIVEKTIEILLIDEAQKNERWLFNFAELKKYSNFIILFGSILNNTKDANDIDILSVVSNPKNFTKIEKEIYKIQLSQIKKIHAINLTENELKKELKEHKNNAYIDAIKNGIILFGQNKFIKFVKIL